MSEQRAPPNNSSPTAQTPICTPGGWHVAGAAPVGLFIRLRQEGPVCLMDLCSLETGFPQLIVSFPVECLLLRTSCTAPQVSISSCPDVGWPPAGGLTVGGVAWCCRHRRMEAGSGTLPSLALPWRPPWMPCFCGQKAIPYAVGKCDVRVQAWSGQVRKRTQTEGQALPL